MIQDRRGAVLDRAIAALHGATPTSIKEVTHDIGGAIGFYGFEKEGKEILDYSRALSETPSVEKSIEVERERLLKLLKSARERVGGEVNE
jgi:hypothetical protein